MKHPFFEATCCAMFSLWLCACGSAAPAPLAPASPSAPPPGSVSPAKVAPAPGSKQYPILLDRELKPGVEHPLHVYAITKERKRTTVGGQLTEEENHWRLLELVGKVNQLDRAGTRRYSPQRFELREFQRADSADSSQETLLVNERTTITATPMGEKLRYTLNEPPLADEAQAAIPELLGSRAQRGQGTVSLFGSSKPRAVGERWSVDLSRLKREVQEFDIRPEQVKGGVQLLEIREVDGVECVVIDGAFEAQGFSLRELPPGGRVLSSRLAVHFEGTFPTDLSLQPLTRHTQMTFDVELETPTDLGPSTVRLTSERSRKEFTLRGTPEEPAFPRVLDSHYDGNGWVSGKAPD